MPSRRTCAASGSTWTATSAATCRTPWWVASAPRYDDVRGHVADAYARGQERRLTLSEEQLSVGKRQVQAGEVGLRKSVETEHVRETVDLSREEVTIDRRPLSADTATDATIQAGEIRVPVMEEQVVIEKRMVPTEEIVIRKRMVQENETVEADLRRERLEVTDSTTTRHAGSGTGTTSGARDRATDSGVLDRVADTADNLKDRVDGNPASKPGPDATDRRI